MIKIGAAAIHTAFYTYWTQHTPVDEVDKKNLKLDNENSRWIRKGVHVDL